MIDRIDTDDYLSVCPKETIRVQLIRQFIEREVDDMFLPAAGNSKRYLILRIKVMGVNVID